MGVIFKKDGEIKKSDVYIADVVGYDATKDLAVLQLSGKVPDDVNELRLSNKLLRWDQTFMLLVTRIFLGHIQKDTLAS